MNPIPEGWQLVPKEPTPEMLDAFRNESLALRPCAEGYRAMLEAAPKPTLAQLQHPPQDLSSDPRILY